MVSSTRPRLPTPPNLQHEAVAYDFEDSSNAETAILRSRIVTPAPQQSPPTPDNTPPRFDPSYKGHFLGTQPSLASTKAESFQTAREHISSEDEEEPFPVPPGASVPQWLHNVPSANKVPFQLRPSPLAKGEEDLRSASRSQANLQNEIMTSQSNEELGKTGNEQASDVHSTLPRDIPSSPNTDNKHVPSQTPMVVPSLPEDNSSYSIQAVTSNQVTLPTPPPSNDHPILEAPESPLGTAETLDPELEPQMTGLSSVDTSS
jgi:hypothetical protein